MGRASRTKPARLAEKLLEIRNALGLSQNEMIQRLGNPENMFQASISGYERGEREPPLLILLQYARLAGVSMDVLVDDKLELPKIKTRKPGS